MLTRDSLPVLSVQEEKIKIHTLCSTCGLPASVFSPGTLAGHRYANFKRVDEKGQLRSQQDA